MTTEHAILQVLANVSPRMMPQPTLLSDVRMQLARAVTTAELEQALAKLDGKHQVTGITGEDYTRWKISPNGEARLAELIS